MCGHYHGTTKGKKVPKGTFYRQFAKQFNKYNYARYPMVCVYNAGSILNNDEMDSDDLEKILVQIDSNENIKHVVIESRPEYITSEAVSKVKALLPNTALEIGIGLETCSEIIRDLCINKGFTFEDYSHAAEIVRSAGVTLLTYLTVKPLFISSDEAVSDVLESISKIQMMTDVISLEPTSVQVGTLVEYFYINGYYNMPTGWLIQRILKNIYKKTEYLPFELRIGGFEFFPTPEHIISNCSVCDPKLYNAINIYNTTKDHFMIDALECNCKTVHNIRSVEEEKLFNGKSIDTRVASIIASNLMRGIAVTPEG